MTATKEPPALTPDITSRPITKRHTRSPFVVIDLYRSAVGKKWVMALTGIALMGFVFFHMVGNLKMYIGPEDFNHYAEFLRELLVPILPRTVALWLLRIGLIVAFALHIHCAYGLTRINQKARPVRYQSPRDYVAVSFAARTMRWSGIIVGLFLLFHLADLTWGWLPWTDYVRGDPYHNLTESLSNLPVAILYVVANVALAIHVFHGTWSLFQSLGINNPRYNSARRGLASGLAGLLLIGNLSFPIMVQVGLLSEDGCDAPCGIEEPHGEDHGTGEDS